MSEQRKTSHTSFCLMNLTQHSPEALSPFTAVPSHVETSLPPFAMHRDSALLLKRRTRLFQRLGVRRRIGEQHFGCGGRSCSCETGSDMRCRHRSRSARCVAQHPSGRATCAEVTIRTVSRGFYHRTAPRHGTAMSKTQQKIGGARSQSVETSWSAVREASSIRRSTGLVLFCS